MAKPPKKNGKKSNGKKNSGLSFNPSKKVGGKGNGGRKKGQTEIQWPGLEEILMDIAGTTDLGELYDQMVEASDEAPKLPKTIVPFKKPLAGIFYNCFGISWFNQTDEDGTVIQEGIPAVARRLANGGQGVSTKEVEKEDYVRLMHQIGQELAEVLPECKFRPPK